MQSSAQIILQNISAGIRHARILENINWQINSGEHWIITGPMGAGKTILARTLRRDLRLFSGQISYPFLKDGAGFDAMREAVQLVSFSDTSKLFKSVNAVHYYQQRYNAFDSDGHLTVREYLSLAGLDLEDKEHQNVLQQTGLDQLLDLERIKLSSGQTRKMLIAKAIFKNPRVLILDNPYLGLDAASRQIFNDFLDHLANDKDITIVLSGHYQQLPKCISHRLHLKKGRVVAQGKLNEVASQIPLEKKLGEPSDLKPILEYFQNNAPSVLPNAILRLEDVKVQYGENTILEDFSWQMGPGERWALLGQNGSGKSTLLSLIYADNPKAYSNRVFLFDRRRGSGESIWEVKKKIGFTSSELHAYFDHNFPARDVVLTGMWDGFIVRHPADHAQEKIIAQLFRYFGISHLLDSPYRSLSTGMQRLLFFMRALIKAPPLLLLDEPFQALDAPTIAKCRLLLDTVLTQKHSLVFITHYKKEIPDSVDQILSLN